MRFLQSCCYTYMDRKHGKGLIFAMTNRERIEDNYEDALFAVWMDDFARRLGAKYMEENERLNNTPEAAVPQALQRKNLETIFRALRRDAHTFTLKSIGRVAVRFLAAALILAALFGCAYAAFEPFRVGTLNLLMDLDEKVASFQLVDENAAMPDAPPLTPNVEIGWLPEGYSMLSPVKSGFTTTIDCYNEDGALMRVRVYASDGAQYTFDIEDPDIYEKVIIAGHNAILIKKESLLRITWADDSTGTFIYIESDSVDKQILLQVAENIGIYW